jgi:hypothetical protein
MPSYRVAANPCGHVIEEQHEAVLGDDNLTGQANQSRYRAKLHRNLGYPTPQDDDIALRMLLSRFTASTSFKVQFEYAARLRAFAKPQMIFFTT